MSVTRAAVELEFLSRVPLFAGLPIADLERISQQFVERKYRRNETVFVEEDTGHYMYVIQSGKVKVSRFLASGKELILAFHQDGDYFGEMSLLDGLTTPATVTAVAASRILVLGRSQFQELTRNPMVNRALLLSLCSRWRSALEQIQLLNFNNAQARVRTALYQLCQRQAKATSEGMRITVKMTHRELADLTGLTRETATRVLSQLQSDGLVRVERREFLVPDPEELIDLNLS